MDCQTYRNQMRRLELHGQGLRGIIVCTAFRLSLQQLVDTSDQLGEALRRWYRDQRRVKGIYDETGNRRSKRHILSNDHAGKHAIRACK